jgi:C1A family cysteine protease
MTDAYLWTIDHGIVEWDAYWHSYLSKASKCQNPKDNKKTRFYNKGANEEENVTNEFLKARLAQQPVGAAFYSDLKCMDFYKNGVMMASDCNKDCSNPNKKEVNHAVTIVGYGISDRKDCSEYWLIKNSWGNAWGIDGHFKFCADRKTSWEQAYGGCQIASFIMWPSL